MTPRTILLLIGIFFGSIISLVIYNKYQHHNKTNPHVCNDETCPMFMNEEFKGCGMCTPKSFCHFGDSMHWEFPKMEPEAFRKLLIRTEKRNLKNEFYFTTLDSVDTKWVCDDANYLPTRQWIITTSKEIKDFLESVDSHTRYLGQEKGIYVIYADPIAVDSLQSLKNIN
jgi:hypothetical protein